MYNNGSNKGVKRNGNKNKIIAALVAFLIFYFINLFYFFYGVPLT